MFVCMENNYYKPDLREFVDGFEFEVCLKSVGFGVLDDKEFKMVSDYMPVWTEDVYKKSIHESAWNCNYDFKVIYEDNRIRAIKK